LGAGQPVHYRWMYPFERFFKWLKQKAKSKSCPEGSMLKEYLMYELNSFGTHYFDSKIPSMHNPIRRNEVMQAQCTQSTLSIFHTKECPFAPRQQRRFLTEQEYAAAHVHVLLNCNEVQPYLE